LEATCALRVAPTACAYVGNRFIKDITGCKQAGFALGILIENPGQPAESYPSGSPDLVIHSLSELLTIFPVRVYQG
jgi:FMN phosphatase YigB (HAD superfamily)